VPGRVDECSYLAIDPDLTLRSNTPLYFKGRLLQAALLFYSSEGCRFIKTVVRSYIVIYDPAVPFVMIHL